MELIIFGHVYDMRVIGFGMLSEIKLDNQSFKSWLTRSLFLIATHSFLLNEHRTNPILVFLLVYSLCKTFHFAKAVLNKNFQNF